MKLSRVSAGSRTTGWSGFSNWLQAKHPQVYREVSRRLTNSGALSGLGFAAPVSDPIVAAAQNPSLLDKITSTIKDVVAVALPAYQQKKIIDVQLARAKQGLDPLNLNELSDLSSVKVGVDSSTRNTGLIIAGVLAAVLIVPKLLRR